jgi:hypothetical protein
MLVMFSNQKKEMNPMKKIKPPTYLAVSKFRSKFKVILKKKRKKGNVTQTKKRNETPRKKLPYNVKSSGQSPKSFLKKKKESNIPKS